MRLRRGLPARRRALGGFWLNHLGGHEGLLEQLGLGDVDPVLEEVLAGVARHEEHADPALARSDLEGELGSQSPRHRDVGEHQVHRARQLRQKRSRLGRAGGGPDPVALGPEGALDQGQGDRIVVHHENRRVGGPGAAR